MALFTHEARFVEHVSRAVDPDALRRYESTLVWLDGREAAVAAMDDARRGTRARAPLS